MVAKFGDDHVRDGRFGRQPAGHDVLRCVRLHDGAGAAATDVFWAACDQHAPLRRDHVEALADVLADLRHGAATARAKRTRRLDDPFHPRQMGRQAAAIAMRTLIRRAPRSALDHSLGSLLRRVQDALRDLHVFQRQVILIWPQLLGRRAELLASQFAENDLQPTPRLFRRRQRRLMFAQGRLRLRQKRFQLFIFVAQRRDAHALFRAHRRRACHIQNSFRVILPQLSSRLGTPRFFRADQPPIQPLEQGCEHRRRYPYHAVCDRWPNELATFKTLVHQHQTRSIPDQNLDPVRSFRSEHEGCAAERVETAKHLLHLRRKPIVATAEVDRPRRDVNLQIGTGPDHRDARIARITRDSCSPSMAVSVRSTTSPIAISSLIAGT
ncbi:hypothetical protein ACVWZ6_005865 [Bradyrhizobium sp. GM6.1]